jgi:hypothetical protein
MSGHIISIKYADVRATLFIASIDYRYSPPPKPAVTTFIFIVAGNVNEVPEFIDHAIDKIQNSTLMRFQDDIKVGFIDHVQLRFCENFTLEERAVYEGMEGIVGILTLQYSSITSKRIQVRRDG